MTYRKTQMYLLPLAAAALIGAVTGSAEAESLRCSGTVVTRGDSAYEVTKACGEPQDKQFRTEYRTDRAKSGGTCPPGSTNCSTSQGRTVEVQIEEWTYDRGRMHLLQHLRFEDGRLVAVRSGNRGGR